MGPNPRGPIPLPAGIVITSFLFSLMLVSSLSYSQGLPRRCRPRDRRRRPQQPGIKNACSVNCPERNAHRTSSTDPQVFGITHTPADVSIASSGREMAPQISTCVPSSAMRLALETRSVFSKGTSRRPSSLPPSTSTSIRWLATSKTGEILPLNVGIMTIIEWGHRNMYATVGCNSIVDCYPSCGRSMDRILFIIAAPTPSSAIF